MHHTRCHWRSPCSATNAKALVFPTNLEDDCPQSMDIYLKVGVLTPMAPPQRKPFSWMITGGFWYHQTPSSLELQGECPTDEGYSFMNPKSGSVDMFEFTIKLHTQIYIYIYLYIYIFIFIYIYTHKWSLYKKRLPFSSCRPSTTTPFSETRKVPKRCQSAPACGRFLAFESGKMRGFRCASA